MAVMPGLLIGEIYVNNRCWIGKGYREGPMTIEVVPGSCDYYVILAETLEKPAKIK